MKMITPTGAQVLVIVPTYNEVGNVKVLVDEVHALAPDLHIIFVDDNSTDGTRELIIQMIAADPQKRLHILQRERKLGLGSAYIAAFQWALARSYEVIVEMDADLSHRPVDLVSLIEAAQKAPVVIGSRYISQGGTENWGLIRQFISRGGSLYARLVLRMAVRDLTGGFNAWQRRVLASIAVNQIASEGYCFQIELKFRAALAGFPLLEVPITFVERRAGKSKMSSGIVLEAIYRVWKLTCQRHFIKQQLRSPTKI